MRLAKKEGFRARSVYKLEELDEKFKLFKKGQNVLDIGAAPGSWLQYVSKKIGGSGKVIGIDLQEIQKIAENVKTYKLDIYDNEALKNILKESNFEMTDLILSDIAPNTTGIKYVDQGRSVDLSRRVFEIAKIYLKPGGRLVMKVFDGEHFQPFIKELKQCYKSVSVTKAVASRDRSSEVYVVCN